VKLRDATGLGGEPQKESAKSILKLMGRSSASMLTDEIEVGGNQRFVAHHRVNRQLAHRAPPIGEARKGTFRPMEVMRTMPCEYVADPEAISLLSSADSA
jgi:hypothetical protein